MSNLHISFKISNDKDIFTLKNGSRCDIYRWETIGTIDKQKLSRTFNLNLLFFITNDFHFEWGEF